jgi:hypothetical protein
LLLICASHGLGVRNCRLLSLSGLSGCVALERLICDNNELTTLDSLEFNKQLTEISCKANQISKVQGLGTLTALHELYLSGNNVKSMKSWPAMPIYELHIGSNQLTSLEGMQKFAQLEVLDVSNNMLKLGSLGMIDRLTGITELIIAPGQLTESTEYEDWTQRISHQLTTLVTIDGTPTCNMPFDTLDSKRPISGQGLRPGSSMSIRPGSSFSRPGSSSGRPPSGASAASVVEVEQLQQPPVMPTRNLSLRTINASAPAEALEKMHSSVHATRTQVQKLLAQTKMGLLHRDEQVLRSRKSAVEMLAPSPVPEIEIEALEVAESSQLDSSRPSSSSSTARGRIADARSFAQKHLTADEHFEPSDEVEATVKEVNPYLGLLR